MAQRTKDNYYNVAPSQRVLVAIMNNRRDFAIARDQHWYRIPVKSAPRRVDANRLAFYQTKAFDAEKWSIRYQAQVEKREIARRIDLLPDEPAHPRAQEEYIKFHLAPLQELKRPIISKRGRRIVFIPTTLRKFKLATEINDLFHESPLEDLLWKHLKAAQLFAERQFYLTINAAHYCLDFALFCTRGAVNVECDGDQWHSDKTCIIADNQRNNDLASEGWTVLRFNTQQLHHGMESCLDTIWRAINRNGGMSDTPQKYFSPNNSPQLTLPF